MKKTFFRFVSYKNQYGDGVRDYISDKQEIYFERKEDAVKFAKEFMHSKGGKWKSDTWDEVGENNCHSNNGVYDGYEVWICKDILDIR